MKRLGVRLLKYLTFAALFLTLGPVTVKLMFGDHQEDGRRHLRRREPVVDHGLPVDPDDMPAAAVKYSPVCQLSRCWLVSSFHKYLTSSDIILSELSSCEASSVGTVRRIEYHNICTISHRLDVAIILQLERYSAHF